MVHAAVAEVAVAAVGAPGVAGVLRIRVPISGPVVAASLGVVSSGELDGLVQALEAGVVDVDALFAARGPEGDALQWMEGCAGFLGVIEGVLSGQIALAHNKQAAVFRLDGEQLRPGRVRIFAPIVDGDGFVVVGVDDVNLHDIFL